MERVACVRRSRKSISRLNFAEGRRGGRRVTVGGEISWRLERPSHVDPNAKLAARDEGRTREGRREAAGSLDDAMLSQAEAADLIGVDHRTMRRYVLANRYP
jgi:hypothetical protein